jgi:hypothetical protein
MFAYLSAFIPLWTEKLFITAYWSQKIIRLVIEHYTDLFLEEDHIWMPLMIPHTN